MEYNEHEYLDVAFQALGEGVKRRLWLMNDRSRGALPVSWLRLE